MFIGIIIGSIGITTVFAANGIKSAVFSSSKVTLDGNTVALDSSLISIVKDGENDARLYMPFRETLEYPGYGVQWDGEHNTVNLISNPTQPSEDVKTDHITVAEETKGQKISFDLNLINANGYTELGIYTLSAGDKIHFDVDYKGYGLSVGFVKPTETITINAYTYFEQRIYKENTMLKSDNVPVPAELSGEYKLFVRGVGEKQLTDIKGTVEITKGNAIEEKSIKAAENKISEDNKKAVEYKNIDLNISGTENALKAGKDTPMENYYYYAFGPYLYAGNNEEKVVFDVQNGAGGSMFIGTSPNKEVNKGVCNTFSADATYKGSIDIFADDSRYYYVIIGAKDIKNLKGSIQIPVYN